MTPASEPTRYEAILAARSGLPGDLAARFARASRAARAAVEVNSEHEAAIRDVAAGVAGPALAGFVLWIQEQVRQRGLRRLRFLSRDGQVLYELTRRLFPGLDLEYVYSSRLTWSFAATQPGRLAEAPWLFNSFIKSNAADVCARLGLTFAQYRPAMLACGVSLDPEVRADQRGQAQALLRFVDLPEVARAVEARIAAMRGLVLDYAALGMDRRLPDDDVRPLVHQVMDAFWCHPSLAEARAWGTYPYDSDPAGTAVRPLARPFAAEGQITRGDRAWLAGSLALSTPEARVAYIDQAPEHELAGAPETDLFALSGGRFCRRSL